MLPHVVHLDLERGWRGGQRQLYYLVAGLAERGYRQSVVCRRNSPLIERLEGLPGLNLHPVKNRFTALWRIARLRGDIFHAHTGSTIPLALLGRGRSIVTRRLDLPPKSFFLRRVDAVVAISRSVLQVLRNTGVPEARLHLIHSAVATPSGDDNELEMAWPDFLPRDIRVLLSLGALEDQKDPVTAVKAMVYLDKNIHLVWVGEGSWRKRAEQTARELDVQNRVHFVGFDPQPNRWFSIADVFVLPSRHEGLGTVYLDAFARGIPVVGTTIPGTDDVLIDRKTALRTPPGDAASLARAIFEVLTDQALRSALVQQAHNHLAGFQVATMVAAYDALYQRIC